MDARLLCYVDPAPSKMAQSDLTAAGLQVVFGRSCHPPCMAAATGDAELWIFFESRHWVSSDRFRQYLVAISGDIT